MEAKTNSELRILGQKIPLNIYSVFIVLFICITIGYIYSRIKNPDEFIVQMIHGGLYNNVGKLTESESQPKVLIKIWTPSAETWNSISDNNEKKMLEKTHHDKWYKTNDTIIIHFGKKLMNYLNAIGYNRVECWGEGTTGLKKGFLWYITFPKKVTIKDITSLYEDFFYRDENIYIEIYNISCERYKN